MYYACVVVGGHCLFELELAEVLEFSYTWSMILAQIWGYFTSSMWESKDKLGSVKLLCPILLFFITYIKIYITRTLAYYALLYVLALEALTQLMSKRPLVDAAQIAYR